MCSGSLAGAGSPAAEPLCVARGADRLDRLEDALAHLRLADLVVGAHELERFALDERITLLVEGRALLAERNDLAAATHHGSAGESLARHLVEEVGDRHVEDLGELKQTRGADAVGAALVLLDLLERQVDRVAELGLRHAEQGTALAHPGADMHVDRMRSARQDKIDLGHFEFSP